MQSIVRIMRITTPDIAIFSIWEPLVSLLEAGLVYPSVYGLGGGIGPVVVGM